MVITDQSHSREKRVNERLATLILLNGQPDDSATDWQIAAVPRDPASAPPKQAGETATKKEENHRRSTI